jgi:single-strand DNA-binding protein
MANLNKVLLIGRLTRDPEVRTFGNGGKVANFGFAVNNRKKNAQTGEWEDEPVFLDVEAFNRETGRKLADLVEQHFRKGAQFYLEGHLRLDQWQDKNDGSKRQKIKIVLDDFQFLEARQDGMSGGGSPAPRAASRPGAPAQAGGRRAPAAPASNGNYDAPEPDVVDEPQTDGDIPF